jgi:hypothetical protein
MLLDCCYRAGKLLKLPLGCGVGPATGGGEGLVPVEFEAYYYYYCIVSYCSLILFAPTFFIYKLFKN